MAYVVCNEPQPTVSSVRIPRSNHPIAQLIEDHTVAAELSTTSEEYMYHAEVINVLYSIMSKIPYPTSTY
jgi:hypothetical protein